MTIEIETLKSENVALKEHIVKSAFAASEWARENARIPADMLASIFGHAFRVENGRVVAFDGSGAQIMSQVKLGEPASFDDALQRLVKDSPYGIEILKTRDGGKSGSGGIITRTEFDAMSPAEQMKHIRSGKKVRD